MTDTEIDNQTNSNQTGGDITLMSTTQSTIISGKDCDVPKLRGVEYQDYGRWKREKEWWKTLTRVEKKQKGTSSHLAWHYSGRNQRCSGKISKDSGNDREWFGRIHETSGEVFHAKHLC